MGPTVTANFSKLGTFEMQCSMVRVEFVPVAFQTAVMVRVEFTYVVYQWLYRQQYG